MRPTQHERLSRAVRSSFCLNRAWKYVYERAKNSRDERAQCDAAIFAENETYHIRKLQTALRDNTYKFSPQHGYAKKRGKNKRPRPIVVATVKDRVVQRAILSVCQSKSHGLKRYLGKLPEVLDTPTSVGGIPKKGQIEAVNLITGSIKNGAKWYIRSDIKDFFTRISKASISSFLSNNVDDPQFVRLFMDALNVELENEEEVREILDLFPSPDIGVAQGSSLSALCANIILRDLDKKTNGRGVTTVRYLDDILILGPNRLAVEKVWEIARSNLASIGMQAHDPAKGSGKAAKGEVSAGFDFLSLSFQGEAIFPSRKARDHLLASVRAEIARAKATIGSSRNSARRAEKHFAQSLALLDLKIRGWGDAFAVTNKRISFAQLDTAIDALLERYFSWYFATIRNATPTQRRRILGITLLVDTPTRE